MEKQLENEVETGWDYRDLQSLGPRVSFVVVRWE